MSKPSIFCSLLLFALGLNPVAGAQDAPKPPDAAKPTPAPVHYYHFEFVFEELDAGGSPVNHRSYATTASTENRGGSTIVVGSKSPIATGTDAGDGNVDKLQTHYEYMDVGIKIQARDLREVGDQLALELRTEVSNLAGTPSPVGAARPVVRENVCDGPVLIPIGKPTVVHKTDALDSKGSIQLVVTVTPVHE